MSPFIQKTIWLTGLSASGKTTLASALQKKMVALHKPSYILDGDVVRQGLNKDLGFSVTDRTENLRRVAEVAKLINDLNITVIAAFISPSAKDREMVKQIIGQEKFCEVYLSTPLSACEKRDPKGLYKKARAGEIAQFTGVSADYEVPTYPSLQIDTSINTIEESTNLIINVLR